MVYLLKMVIFHGYVSHNQMVIIPASHYGDPTNSPAHPYPPAICHSSCPIAHPGASTVNCPIFAGDRVTKSSANITLGGFNIVSAMSVFEAFYHRFDPDGIGGNRSSSH